MEWQRTVNESVEPRSNLFTDGNTSYQHLSGYAHDIVKHGVGEYVKGIVHANGMESSSRF